MQERSRIDCESGAAAVEFALVLMLLVTLLFGIIQYGYTFFEYIQVAHAAREGVRWGALGSTDTEIRSKAIAAAPTLALSAGDISIASDSIAISVTVSHPVTRLSPLPSMAVPASVSSTAVQRIE